MPIPSRPIVLTKTMPLPGSGFTLRTFLLACVAAACVACAEAPPQGARKPDVHYEPAPPNVVEEMMQLALPGPGDTVYDLGCGDGRLVIAAVRRGARGVCVDIDPQRIRESRENAQVAGVADRIRFVEGDLFTTDFRDASVVFLFLWPDLNLKLRPRLTAELQPGTRIVSYVHDMGDWKPDASLEVRGLYGMRQIYRWNIRDTATRR
jgi:SAM-dependent methyltransferase